MVQLPLNAVHMEKRGGKVVTRISVHFETTSSDPIILKYGLQSFYYQGFECIEVEQYMKDET
jgi:hypothetical protein